MINHGIVTGALFLGVGMLYGRTRTRKIRVYGGLASALPVLQDLPALLPELTLLVLAIGLLCGDMFFPRERAFLQWLTVVGAITALAAIVAVSGGRL